MKRIPLARSLLLATIIVALIGFGISIKRTFASNGFCGNGILEKGETCDLGARNGKSDSGCTTKCTLVSGKPRCGDGILEQGEKCDTGKDNGNFTPCDLTCLQGGGNRGCTTACKVQKGYHCGPNNSGCYKLCGDGILETGEKCDLGSDPNAVVRNGNNMGCTADCKVQAGYSCKVGFVGKGISTNCKTHDCCLYHASCGNGVVDWPNEQCDHGSKNGKTGDSCSRDCMGKQ